MQISQLHEKYGNSSCKLDQIPGEFDWLMEKFLSLNPKNICEIGSWHGGTMYYWLRHSAEDATAISVDIDHTHLTRTLETSWSGFEGRTKMRMVTGSSAEKKTLKAVKRILPAFDFLFVDGDHTRKGLLADLRIFGPLVRPGGMIAIHDTNPLAMEAQEKGGHGVSRVWKEVQAAAGDSYSCEEIYLRTKDVHLGSYGIGVVNVNDKFECTLE